jgi:ABC-type transport system substrate-binding protein
MLSIRSAKWLCVGALLLTVACPALPDGPRFVGAGGALPRRGGTLMLWEESRVRLLDPHRAGDVISGLIIDMLYDALYTYDAQMRMVPALAAQLPQVSADGLHVLVSVRPDVRFHNGRRLTARDVVWSIERMLHPTLHSPGARYFESVRGVSDYRAQRSQHVVGITADDEHTVRFELERPDQSFTHVLAMRYTAPIAREEAERSGADLKRRPAGTGAFKLASWDPGVRLIMERNDRYYDAPRPYVDRVVFEEGLKADTAFMRFRNGEVDIVPRMSPADQLLLETLPWRPYRAVSARADIFGIVMNVELAPFDNVHVRRAVAFALDRERWCRARNWSIRPAGQMVPPQIPGYDEALPHVQRFDLVKARDEMRLAGHPGGLPEAVTLWVLDSAKSLMYGQLLQADLAKIGIEVRLKTVSFPVYLEETGKPRTAQMVAAGWAMDFPDPSNVLGLLSSRARAPRDSQNRSFFSDKRLDALLDRALIEQDPTARAALYRTANDFVAEAAPWAFYANSQQPQAWQPYVRGYVPHPTYWLAVKDVWLDLPRKRVASLLNAGLRASSFAALMPLYGAGR